MNLFRQRGSVIIITLWTITLLTILITVLAGQIRLSARAALFHQDDLENYANVLAAVNQAEMEVMLELMNPPASLVEVEDLNRNRLARFNGDEQTLHFPQAQDITVRIYDHAGRINMREISRPRLRDLLAKRLGDDADQEQLDELMAAWSDWLDLNDQATPGGAEADYYMSLDPPYLPRNGSLESVEEILLIRGFAEVFEGVDMDAAFTLYGENERLNLNVATIEAMRMLPGLDDELIEAILLWRRENQFRGNGDVAQVVPAESMAELRTWLANTTYKNYYTIMAYPSAPADEESGSEAEVDEDRDANAGEDEPYTLPLVDDPVTTAYAEIVQIVGATTPIRVLKVNPYQSIPIRYQAPAEEERDP